MCGSARIVLSSGSQRRRGNCPPICPRVARVSSRWAVKLDATRECVKVKQEKLEVLSPARVGDELDQYEAAGGDARALDIMKRMMGESNARRMMGIVGGSDNEMPPLVEPLPGSCPVESCMHCGSTSNILMCGGCRAVAFCKQAFVALALHFFIPPHSSTPWPHRTDRFSTSVHSAAACV